MVKLWQIEVLVGGGKSIGKACKEAGMTDVTYNRWRREQGGLRGDRARSEMIRANRCPPPSPPWNLR